MTGESTDAPYAIPGHRCGMHSLLHIELARTLAAERRRRAPTRPQLLHNAERYERRLAAVTVGKLARLAGPIELAEHDPTWSGAYRRHAARVVGALGQRVLRIEHVGSTAVPGLPAKPIIDIALVVASSAQESRYVPDLERAGYRLRIREPEWFEHRMLGDDDTTVNLHVFSAGCEETERMTRFRDWLQRSPADRDLYAHAKRELAARDWAYVQQYADAKTDVIETILRKAHAAGNRFGHTSNH